MIKNILLGLTIALLAGAGYLIYALSTIFMSLGAAVFGMPPPKKEEDNKKEDLN